MRKFVLLPDGSYEAVQPGSVVDMCFAEEEFTPIVFPAVSQNQAIQARYDGFRLIGYGHNIASIISTQAQDEQDFIDYPRIHDWADIVFAMSKAEVTAARSLSPPQLLKYRDMRVAGESHNCAEMFATRTFPGVKTDAIFNEGKFSGQSTGECAAHGVWLREQARLAGVSTTGKWYCSGLASFPGDPTAWVDSRGDVLRIAEAKNMTTHGYIEHAAYETDPGDDLDIADDIIEDGVADILESNPHAAVDSVRSELRALRTGAVDNNPLLCQDYTSTEIP